MTLIISPALLFAVAVGLLFIVAGDAWKAVSRLLAAARLVLLRRRLERRTGWLIGFAVGSLDERLLEPLIHLAETAPEDKTIAVVLHTHGGGVQSAQIAMHALGQRRRVVAIVPRRAGSAGAQIALAADQILMGPNAHLGGCDSHERTYPDWLLSGPVLQAHAHGIDRDLARARGLQASVATSIARARRARGDADERAHQLAMRLTSGELGPHSHPLLFDEVVTLGIPAVELTSHEFAAWAKLARLANDALRPEDQ